MVEEKICPYPGLRPFNDDESIFFRGREKNIETIIELFEKKKFMMLTGASGDGKSSLVYAGIVPQAKAGLFKAKYNSWAVADFRPERTPLDNLVTSLNTYFKFENTELLKKELAVGFSSLVSLYKKSPLHLNTESEEWNTADEKQKKALKRKASNLLIIADQFEEFFTNAENYNDGMASVESQAVINILLETAKAALTEDLPIYIICTMRSDYIGQCAAFRGLPEYIGFSQFFVPRLKRSEIQQVIEEPAQLNGDQISSRLSQRLLFDITEGYDQLPILQHALNQIWKIAENGQEEMDLIHYAKVGGLPPSQLPSEDKAKFNTWFNQLPDFKKQLFQKPSLENILNAHADELLEVAFAKCKEKNPKIEEKITAEDAKQIIKGTFKCLTKIDDARAVRNRMTLQEITDIINNPNIDVKTVGKVLDIFRQQGNTFIKPFITEDPDTLKTHKETILDITHESLIRNWDILNIWAQEEHENLMNFQDFNKQLQRWINSDKDNGYLLPIGPLNFFETWYNACKPNKYWLARYDESDISFEEKLRNADQTLNEAKEFIGRSARKLFVSRTILKYGANKVLAYLGLILLISACTFFYFDFKKKQNPYVLNEVIEKGMNLLHSRQVKENIKAKFIINYERLNPGTAEKILASLDCDTLSFDIANEAFALVQDYTLVGKQEVKPLETRLLSYMDSILTQKENKSEINAGRIIKRVNSFLKLAAYIKYYSPSDYLQQIIKKHSIFLEKYINASVQNPKTVKTEQFYTSIELLMTLTELSSEKANQIITQLTPFSKKSETAFSLIFPKNEKRQVDFGDYLSHKGGYQLLSYVYASVGDYPNMGRCLDSLIKNNSDYKKNWNENIADILFFLVKYNHFSTEKIEPFYEKYAAYSSISKSKFYENLISQIIERQFYFQFIEPNFPLEINLIQFFSFSGSLDLVWDAYLESLTNLKNVSAERQKLDLAMFYKKRGIFSFIIKKDSSNAYSYFEKSISIYQKIQPSFLDEEYSFYNQSGEKNSSAAKIKNSTAFLLPWNLYGEGYKPLYFYIFNNPNNYKNLIFPFFDYVLKNQFIKLYKSDENLEVLETFFYQYLFINKFNYSGYRKANINYHYLSAIIDAFGKFHSDSKTLNPNFVNLVYADRAFEIGDTATAFKLFTKLNLKETLTEDFQNQEDIKAVVNIALLENLAKNLAKYNRIDDANKIIKALKNPWDKRNCLIDICYSLQEMGNSENTFVYLDSLFTDIENKPKFGMQLFRTIGLIGGKPLYNAALSIYKDIDDKLKPRALNNFIRGIACSGAYYKAYSYIPEYVSRTNELDLYNEILHAEFLNLKKSGKIEFDTNFDFFESKNYGLYIPENYEYEQEHFMRFAD